MTKAEFVNTSELLNLWTQSKRTSLSGLGVPASAYLLSKIAQSFSTLLIVVPDEETSNGIKNALQAFSKEDVASFPSLDVLPYLGLDPDPDTIADRLSFLFQMINEPPRIVVTSAEALTRRLIPSSFLRNSVLEIKRGDEVGYDNLVSRLIELGYEHTPIVEDVGTFSKRGAIIDIWAPQDSVPIRLELDGDRIESIRKFDPTDQKSKSEIDGALLLPAGEVPLDVASREGARQKILNDVSDIKGQVKRQLLSAFKEGQVVTGSSTLFPLFHKKTATILDYLPPTAGIVWFDPDEISEKWKAYKKNAEEAWEECPGFEKAVTPSELLIDEDGIKKSWNNVLEIEPLPSARDNNCEIDAVPNFKAWSIDERWERLEDFIRDCESEGLKLSIVCHSDAQKEKLEQTINARFKHALPIQFLIGRIDAGFIWKDERSVIISDADLVDVAPAPAPVSIVPSTAITALSELEEGDLIVHESHGIGRFISLTHLEAGGVVGDYLVLEYAESAKLYVPADRLTLIEKYASSGDYAPQLDKLGGNRWERAKKKAKKAADDIAQELVELYASRAGATGFAFPPLDASYSDFCTAFPYDETNDQKAAIEAVMSDMDKPLPTDRLICGDVGFGKTEVALRATFRAVMSGTQVVIVVPTTVLALQHYVTFTKRFDPFPVRVEMLSRFTPRRKIKEIAADMKKGLVDIVVGTHKLLQDDVKFKNIGLLIVDEEHRFGVKHKDQIKKLKENVDVISLTATPIPRTLYMSLVGIRDVSLIATPPSARRATSTYVSKFDDQLIRRAILSEVERGGQVFFVHNRVQTIDSMHVHLKRILPEVKITVGHGQMKERHLEKAMMEFVEGKTQVLLCTAIIESGLDIPNANTIIIDRADRFGLAQLYQLRGRVGRSDKHAFAYMLLPRTESVQPAAKKRLAALVRYTAMGSGFQIALHDLELRGSGNILGTSQSGHIAEIGYEMYTKILARAVKELKGEKIEEEIDPELKLGVTAFLSDEYVSDSNTRVTLYRRLSSVADEGELTNLITEMTDRFGPAPKEGLKLFDVMEVRLLAKRHFIIAVSVDITSVSLVFHPTAELNFKKFAKLISSNPDRFRMTPKSIIIRDDFGGPDRLEKVKEAIREVVMNLVSSK